MMRHATIPAALALIALSGATALPPDARADDDHHTVAPEDVRTWTIEVDDRTWEAHPATPSYEGTTGLFRLPTAYVLPKGRFSLSFFRDNLDRDPKDLDISILGASLGIGVLNRLEVFGNFGIQNRIAARALEQPGFVNDYPFVSTRWEKGTGDVKVGAKLSLLNDYDGDPVGLAPRGFVKIGTADEEKGLGTGELSYGGDLTLSKGFGEKVDLHASAGYVHNVDPEQPAMVELADAWRFGGGINVPACTNVQLQAELIKTIYTGGDDSFEQTDPLDLVAGPVFWIEPGIFLRGAFSANLAFDDGGAEDTDAMDWQVSIGYHPGFECREVVAPPPPNRNPTVSCAVERAEITAGETVGVRATASDPDGDPLSYEWRATAGRITGTGAAVTFDGTGMGAGQTSTLTVRVSDGRGGSAESECSVRTREEAKPVPETVSCISGGFPGNLSRLNNVDKACLDDVATRLRSDPRSRVIIVGHADGGERTPDAIALRRAEETRDYLVRERGIEEARVTLRSAADSRPLDPGTDAIARSRNRRVEVIFVPEGATPPGE